MIKWLSVLFLYSFYIHCTYCKVRRDCSYYKYWLNCCPSLFHVTFIITNLNIYCIPIDGKKKGNMLNISRLITFKCVVNSVTNTSKQCRRNVIGTSIGNFNVY